MDGLYTNMGSKGKQDLHSKRKIKVNTIKKQRPRKDDAVLKEKKIIMFCKSEKFKFAGTWFLILTLFLTKEFAESANSS